MIDKAMAKRNKTKRQTMVYKTLRRTKDCATRTPQKPGVNSDAPEWLAVPASLVTLLCYCYPSGTSCDMKTSIRK
jgi:hypothetical protein